MAKKIMIVEDTSELLESMSEFFTMGGFYVMSCLRAQIAIDKLADEMPDLIITDLSMPDMDGFELIEKLQANKKLKDIPVAIFSARPRLENEARANSLGVVRYINKPCAPDKLLISVQEILNCA